MKIKGTLYNIVEWAKQWSQGYADNSENDLNKFFTIEEPFNNFFGSKPAQWDKSSQSLLQKFPQGQKHLKHYYLYFFKEKIQIMY